MSSGGGNRTVTTAWLDWLPATLIATWNIASAPFLTKYVVEPIREAMGRERFVLIVGSTVAILGLALLVVGFLHLRQDRWRRLALVGAGLLLVAGYVAVSERGEAAVAVVEHLHFVTYGSLAALLIVPFRRLRALAPFGAFGVLLLVALLDEGMQWLVPVRTGEMFDIWLNLYSGLAGALIGLGLFASGVLVRSSTIDVLRIGWRPERVSPTPRLPLKSEATRILTPLLAAVTLVAAAFVHCVHLGYEIDDPEVGRFRSFFDAAGLARENERAAAEWAGQPPGELTPFEREDWFRTEAGWHVYARDLAQSKEQWATADRENAVLLKYYPAFLTLSNLRTGQPFALNEFDTAAIKRFAGAAADPRRFYSTADNGRIWLRPRPAPMWSGAILIAVALLGLRYRARAARQARTD